MEKKQGKMKEQKKSYSNEEEEEGEERKETKKKEQKDEREEAGKRNATFCVSVIVEVSSYLLWFSDSVLGCSMAFTVGSWWFKVVLKRWAATVAGWAVFFPAHWPTAAQKYVPRSLDHAVFYHKAKELAEKKKKRRKQKRTRRSCGGSPVRAASFRRWTGAPPPTEASERSSGNDQVHLTNRFTYTHPHTAFQIPRRKSTNYREREREREVRGWMGSYLPVNYHPNPSSEAFLWRLSLKSGAVARKATQKAGGSVAKDADRSSPPTAHFNLDSIQFGVKKKYMKRKKTKTDGGRGRIRCGPLDSKTPPRTVSWIFTKQESRKKCRSQNKKHGGHNRVASSVWPRLVTVPLSRFFRLRTQWTSCLLWIMTLSGPQCWNMLTIILAKALPLSKLSVFVMLILHDSSSLSSSRRSVCLFFFVVIARSAWFWAMTPCLIRFCFLDLYFGLSFSQPIKKVA